MARLAAGVVGCTNPIGTPTQSAGSNMDIGSSTGFGTNAIGDIAHLSQRTSRCTNGVGNRVCVGAFR